MLSVGSVQNATYMPRPEFMPVRQQSSVAGPQSTATPSPFMTAPAQPSPEVSFGRISPITLRAAESGRVLLTDVVKGLFTKLKSLVKSLATPITALGGMAAVAASNQKIKPLTWNA